MYIVLQMALCQHLQLKFTAIVCEISIDQCLVDRFGDEMALGFVGDAIHSTARYCVGF